jgi:hypothetical protein
MQVIGRISRLVLIAVMAAHFRPFFVKSENEVLLKNVTTSLKRMKTSDLSKY